MDEQGNLKELEPESFEGSLATGRTNA